MENGAPMKVVLHFGMRVVAVDRTDEVAGRQDTFIQPDFREGPQVSIALRHDSSFVNMDHHTYWEFLEARNAKTQRCFRGGTP